MGFQGIIFDLDGVICSTDHYHYLAWKALSDRLGIPFDLERNNLLRGVSRMDSLEIILEKSSKQYSEQEKEIFAAEKNSLYRESLKEMTPDDLIEEVRQTLEKLRIMGLKLAIGSSSKNAPFILERIGLGTFFDAPTMLRLGTIDAARAAGKMRTEGKTYIMQPDDVVEFRFNV